MKKKKIALFGGSFNPPHLGHSAVVQAIEGIPGIDEIWLMPSANRWDKKISVSGPDRLHMLDLMIGDAHKGAAKHIRAFDHEIRKPDLSTTYGTKAELEKLYPYHEFHFVFGSDIVRDIEPRWVEGKELFKTARFILVERPGQPRLPESALPQHHMLVSVPLEEDISSTLVRAVANDRDKLLKYVTPSVADFISEKGFYTETK